MSYWLAHFILHEHYLGYLLKHRFTDFTQKISVNLGGNQNILSKECPGDPAGLQTMLIEGWLNCPFLLFFFFFHISLLLGTVIKVVLRAMVFAVGMVA